MLALTFLSQKRIDDCLLQIRYVLKNDQNNGLAYNILGSAYMLQEEHDKALNAFNHAIDLAPEKIEVHLKKNQSYALRGELEMAKHELVAALTDSPYVLNARFLKAMAVSENGHILERTQ